MIITVTPAPALDLTQRLDVLEPGESLRVSPAEERPGGKGLNTARVLAQQGVPATAVGPLGGPRGQRVADAMAALAPEVKTRWVDVSAETRASTALVEDSGRVTVLNEVAQPLSGEEHATLRDTAVSQAARCVEETGWATVSIAGSWPRGSGAAEMADMVQTLRSAGAYVAVDTSGELLLHAAAAGADLLKPNIVELKQATGADPGQGLGRLFELGAGSVLLSRGEDGMSHHLPNDIDGIAARLDHVLVGNPTGAGDAAVAGWLRVVDRLGHALTGNDERWLGLETAVTWSAAAVAAPVAGELGLDPETLRDHVVIT